MCTNGRLLYANVGLGQRSNGLVPNQQEILLQRSHTDTSWIHEKPILALIVVVLSKWYSCLKKVKYWLVGWNMVG